MARLLASLMAVVALLLAVMGRAASDVGDTRDHEPVVYDVNAVRFEQTAAERAQRSGDQAHKIFCTCPEELAELSTMCDTVTHQCRQTFCKPLCLRMAWTPIIEVDCSRAPQWAWCNVFAEQVKEAAAAVTAQFQAHVCLDNHFCNRTEALIDWVENANFGKHYPEHKLPIASCQQETEDDTAQHTDATAADAAADVRAALCAGCERVLSVRIQLNSCIPGNAATGFETLQAGSLQERCLYVRDHIGVHQHALLTQLRERVCPCLGCCGDRTCYFPNAEHAWLTDLITSVQHKVTSQLASQGWLSPDGMPIDIHTLTAAHTATAQRATAPPTPTPAPPPKRP